ncbi:ubiquitin D-like [Trichosurus vulpecula]|uniref:ubiquitin D-like n=1 Tax=Trichosurus vulpecula TaxID=9337 RepID=UPI00186AE7C1|nr:ubiquitin D-like [Trichosurus vulpecula]
MATCVLVHVHSQSQELMKFTAQKDDRVKKINEQIRSKNKVPVKNQKLLLGSKTLNPEKKLSHYWLDPSTTIHLTLKVVEPSDEELEVFLKEMDRGRKYPFHIRPTSSVSQAKEVIKAITGVLPEAQIVSCNGKKLEDGKIMFDYCIEKGSIFFLSSFCIGG